MKKTERKNRRSRIFAAFVAVGMLLFCCACGAENTSPIVEGSLAAGEEYVYVPEFYTIDQEQLGLFGIREAQFQKDRMYYRYFTEMVGWWDVGTLEYRELDALGVAYGGKFSFTQEGCVVSPHCFTMDHEGNVYVVWNTCPREELEASSYSSTTEKLWLVKYNGEGEIQRSITLSEDLAQNVNYVSDILVDKEGNLYVGTDSTMYVYNEKLSLEKTIVTGTLYGMFVFNGETVVGVRDNGRAELVAVDVKKEAVEVIFSDIPLYYSFFADGGNGRILWADNTKLYELDLETGQSIEVLSWADAYLNSEYILSFKVLEDGRFVLVYADYSRDVTEVVTLTKTPREQVKEKEVLTLATFSASRSELMDTVAKFNRESEDYLVEIKDYYTYVYDFSEENYQDALTLLHMDIISGEAPDLVYLPDVDLYNLADSQALEDLTPYLEKSEVLTREDFVEGVLEAYEIHGRLVTIPVSFWMEGLFAKERLVGADPGWTLQEMIALREKYPDALFMQYMDKNQALQMCLEYGWESFVEEESGQCYFDSEEFVEVLKFARTFGAWGGGTQEPYDALQKDELLLVHEVITSVENYQMVRQMIEEPSTAIGFPTSDGTPATVITGWGIYGIASRSDNKEGAWEFMESVLGEESMQDVEGFPTRIDLLEEIFAEAMEKTYETDEAGNVLYDAEGNPLEAVKTTWGYGSWTAKIYAATEEEIDKLRQMMSHVRLEGGRSQTVVDIVLEEVSAYFADQKTAEEVAEIIQSRVSLYISENHR